MGILSINSWKNKVYKWNWLISQPMVKPFHPVSGYLLRNSHQKSSLRRKKVGRSKLVTTIGIKFVWKESSKMIFNLCAANAVKCIRLEVRGWVANGETNKLVFWIWTVKYWFSVKQYTLFNRPNNYEISKSVTCYFNKPLCIKVNNT